MYCYQCEETIKGGCTKEGVCGKQDSTAKLQDLLIHYTKQIAKETNKQNHFIIDSLFATVTNTNFDDNYFEIQINKALDILEEPHLEFNEMIDIAEEVSPKAEENEDLRSLKELLIYGVKGMAAYIHHATNLNKEDESIYDFVREALAATLEEKSVEDMIGLVMKCGEIGIKAMALLDSANTSTYGKPEPTKANIGVGTKPGILISGHDLKDMELLLKQTEGTGVDVYTHGEMLPANAYPEFKKYDHLIGNYGGSWHHQKEEFEKFNGPILMTTNCLVPPKDSYKDRVYCTGVVGFTGLKTIGKDFSAIIEKAKTCQPPTQLEEGSITIGYAHDTVLGAAEKVIAAIQSGAIKKFVVMGGCDGRQKDREYYTEYAKSLPSDTIILTAGCAKYRYNKLNLGEIDGIPRVLDAGQCNDSYSLIYIAQQLAKALNIDDINKLPIVYNIAWYEQKAVLVLLALLSLGVKEIMLGPKLPEFVSENVLKVLIEKFSIAKNADVETDIKRI